MSGAGGQVTHKPAGALWSTVRVLEQPKQEVRRRPAEEVPSHWCDLSAEGPFSQRL